jgi:hypothetical protein
MTSIVRSLTALFISTAIVVVPTAASGETQASVNQPTSGWLALSMLTPSGAIALGAAPTAAVCGTAAAIAGLPSPGCVLPQIGSMPPAPEAVPGAPPAPAEFAGPGFPPLPVVLIWLAVLGVDIYLLTKNHHHGVPNSPA